MKGLPEVTMTLFCVFPGEESAILNIKDKSHKFYK